MAAEPSPARDATVVRTLMQLGDFDLESRPDLKASVTRHLKTEAGQAQFLEIVEKLKFRDASDDLLELALSKPEDTDGVKAAALLLAFEQKDRFIKALKSEEKIALPAAKVLGNLGDAACIQLLTPFLTDEKAPVSVRLEAVKAMRGNRQGEQALLKLAQEKTLSPALRFVTADLLLSSVDAAMRAEAAKHLKRPATADAKPLPPLSELIVARGNAAAGRELFFKKGECHKCHIVDRQGKEVGPNLTEIGSKLSREAMYVSILDPSAGISHNYETHNIVTDAGKVISGIVVSETDEEIAIKSADAIIRTIPKDEIEERVKSKVSLMPADLQKNLRATDLIDIVEFLTTLKKK